MHLSTDIYSVVERFTKIFEDHVGAKWTKEQFIALKREGEERYSKKIPPGYKDIKKDAGEFDKFGDLIIWKDMIMKAKIDKCPVIFISDDAKEDWWWLHRGRKIGARPELIEEFRADAQQDFHIYEFSRFLRFAAERFPEIKANVGKVEESLLADEEARRHLDNASTMLESKARLRTLEDERDQIISILSGTPGSASDMSADRMILRVRLDEINKTLSSLSDTFGHKMSDDEDANDI